MNKKIAIITQARLGSTRLPGKILKTVKSKTLLECHIERLKIANQKIVIATTKEQSDEIVKIARTQGVEIFLGDENDVLARYYYAAKHVEAEIVVRVTSDCPLIDAQLINDSLEEYLKLDKKELYISNCHKRTFPRGFDFEIFHFALLEEAFLKATLPFDREHVTPFIRKNALANGHNVDIINPTGDYSHLRLTVDYHEDFQLISKLIDVYNALEMGYKEITNVLVLNPELVAINAGKEQKS